MNAKDKQALWHTLAVGMFYREQSERNPQVYYHWEQAGMMAKLHWQSKAKAAVRALAADPERVAAFLFPEDVAGEDYDCRKEVGREGAPCNVCAAKREVWRELVTKVRIALERSEARG